MIESHIFCFYFRRQCQCNWHVLAVTYRFQSNTDNVHVCKTNECAYRPLFFITYLVFITYHNNSFNLANILNFTYKKKMFNISGSICLGNITSTTRET